uniref:Uncharacterized protein n=1 Tax=Saimiri boliviensis boliviensis TaxID=39432 RepID=A0A2K6URR5_SAIBB
GHNARLPVDTGVPHKPRCWFPDTCRVGEAEPPAACRARPRQGCCSRSCTLPWLTPHSSSCALKPRTGRLGKLHLATSIPSGPSERVSWSFLSELPGLRASGRSLQSWRWTGHTSWLLERGAGEGGTGDLLLGLVVLAAGKGRLL